MRWKSILKPAALVAAAVLLAAAFLAWWGRGWRGDEQLFAHYAQQYAPATALVAVEWWLTAKGKRVYHKIGEGTAFLVDRQGHLVSNRHVAAPWLHDPELKAKADDIKDSGDIPEFGWRMFLWFDGAEALRTGADMVPESELADYCRPETGYRSDGHPRVRVAGVAGTLRTVLANDALLTGDDVAVFEVTPPPKGIRPIPLDPELEPKAAGRAAPVLAIGYPLGGLGTHVTRVTASATRGNIRRVSSNNLIEASVNLHEGNSGGPLIGRHGKALGINTALLSSRLDLMIPIPAPQSDLGLALPAGCLSALLAEVQSGKSLWNGLFDPGLEAKLEKVSRLANAGQWTRARRLAESYWAQSQQPDALTALAVLRYADMDAAGARLSVARALTLDPDFALADFLDLLWVWRQRPGTLSERARNLMQLDWRSDHEFLGYLARTLAGQVSPRAAATAWEDREEQVLAWYLVAVTQQPHRLEVAENYLREALCRAPAGGIHALLVRRELEHVQASRLKALPTVAARQACQADQRRFAQRLRQQEQARQRRLARARQMLGGFLPFMVDRTRLLSAIEPEDKDELIERINLAFEKAGQGLWGEAAKTLEPYLNHPGRVTSANRLGCGLCRAQWLQLARSPEAARAALAGYAASTTDAWYRRLARLLLGQEALEPLLAEAQRDAFYQLTLQTALGLQAEARRDRPAAIRHYLAGLESGVGGFLELELCRERIRALREKDSQTDVMVPRLPFLRN